MSLCLGWVVGIRVIQELEDAVQHLLDGDTGPPALSLVNDTANTKRNAVTYMARQYTLDRGEAKTKSQSSLYTTSTFSAGSK